MDRSGPLALTFVAFLGAAAALAGQQPPISKPADQPTFRSSVTTVPIDVRVVDSDGNPITDLDAGDFTVIENGVRQQIRHFSTSCGLNTVN